MLAFLLSPLGKLVSAAIILSLILLGLRVWLDQHDKALLKGYVLQSEKDASDAVAKKLQHDVLLGQQIREQADKQSEQLDIQAQARREADEKAIAEDKTDGPVVTRGDLDWIDRVRKSK